MKKFFFIAAMASVAFVSCVKNDPAPSVTAQDEITFAAPVVGLNTKAVNEVWNNYPTAAAYDFAVWGHYYAGDTYTSFDAGQLYMNDVTVSYDGTLSGWAPATSYYWPKKGSLTFIAYSPATVEATVDKKGINFPDYTVQADAAQQVDLLFSERAYNRKKVDDDDAGSGVTDEDPSETGDRYAGVHLSFKHALSSILFTARTKETYAGTTITLKGISLLNVKSSGYFSQGLADADGATTAPNAEVWAGQSEPKDYVISGLNQTLDANKYYPSTNSTTAPTVASGLRTSDFILLPQTFDMYPQIQVDYTIQSPHSAAINQVQEVQLNAITPEWEWGKRYIYNIIIGLDEIYFEPYVADWVDDSVAGDDINL